jgi:hypothetical protein
MRKCLEVQLVDVIDQGGFETFDGKRDAQLVEVDEVAQGLVARGGCGVQWDEEPVYEKPYGSEESLLITRVSWSVADGMFDPTVDRGRFLEQLSFVAGDVVDDRFGNVEVFDGGRHHPRRLHRDFEPHPAFCIHGAATCESVRVCQW